MNCFMGYNPLVTKQVKVTVWVCEQDGATPVAPSNPSEGDCFIVYATDEAVLSNSPTSAKSYSNGEWVDAEGGGGGATFPTFTAINDGDSWSCDMTFNEVVALVGEYGDDYGYVPCKEINFLGELSWDCGEYTTDFDVSAWTDMPDTVTALFIFNNNWAFADDGKIYTTSNP